MKDIAKAPPANVIQKKQPFFQKQDENISTFRKTDSFFSPSPIQAKLKVSEPGDKLEREADATADRVMRVPEPVLRTSEDQAQLKEQEQLQKEALPEEKVQKADMPEEKVQKQDMPEENVQMQQDDNVQLKSKEDPVAVSASLQSAIQNKTEGGQQMTSKVRQFMEPRLGADFSSVMIHKDTRSDELNKALNARAFTYKNHIFFAQGQYQPDNSEGKRLLAHELTHTLQQGAATVRKMEAPIIDTAGLGTAARVNPQTETQPTDTPPSLQHSETVNISQGIFDPSEKLKE